MLTLTAINITPGLVENGLADYRVEVRINEKILWKGVLHGHVRHEGASALLRHIAVKLDEQKKQNL